LQQQQTIQRDQQTHISQHLEENDSTHESVTPCRKGLGTYETPQQLNDYCHKNPFIELLPY